MTEVNDGLDAAVPIAVGLLRILGAGRSEAAHVAAALQRHRREMRLEGSSVPTSLDALEKVFARIAVGPPRDTAGHPQTNVGALAVPSDDAVMPDTLLNRTQAAKRLRCSVRTLNRRDLPKVRHGRIVSYRVADLDAFLLNGTS